MLEPLVPRKAQEEAIQAILKDHSHMCAAKVGAGKTLIGIEAILRSGVSTALVCAPLNTRAGWKATLERQSQGTMPFHTISSRKDGKAAHEAIFNGERGVYFIGTEYFRGFSWAKVPIDFLVVDEGHRFQNRKSKNFLLLKTTVKVPNKLYLSGTPAGNKIEGLWSGCHWLWPEEHPYYWPWVTKWLRTERDPYVGKKIMGELNPGALWESLPSKSKFASTYTTEPSIHMVEVELTPAQLKLYKRFEAEGVAWLEDHPLIAELPAVQAMRLRQMTLAVPSIRLVTKNHVDPETGDRWSEEVEEVYFEEDAKSSKIDALAEILADLYVEAPVPVVVYCHSRKFVEIVTKRLQAKGYDARQFIGGMTQHERAWKLENFGKEYDILVATIPTVAEGVDGLQLQSNTEIWLSVSDNRLLNAQAKGRLSRQGQTKTVQRYLIRAAGTIELTQAGRLATDEALLAESLEHDEQKVAA